MVFCKPKTKRKHWNETFHDPENVCVADNFSEIDQCVCFIDNYLNKP